LRREGLDKNTIVVFTSDNGPWLVYGDHGGSAGLLRGGKGGTWEGGMREPAIFWCPVVPVLSERDGRRLHEAKKKAWQQANTRPFSIFRN
jgi:arylsulfatase A-like enzyme